MSLGHPCGALFVVGLGDSKELHAAQILGFGLRLVLGFLCWHGSEAQTHPGGAADAFGSMAI